MSEYALALGRFERHVTLKDSMGVGTFLGKDIQTSEPSVVKCASLQLLPHSTRLRIEASVKKLVALNDDDAVPPVAHGIENDQLILAYPYVEGETLALMLKRGPLPFVEGMKVFRKVVALLMKLHAAELLCHTLKPANIVYANARVRLLDFCFARNLFVSESSYALDIDLVRYLSPEQSGLLQADVGVRSDLYAAGLLLYEMLTGVPVFDSGTVSEILRNHIAIDIPDPRVRVPTLPRVVGDMVRHLLAVDPKNRYQSTEALLFDVDAIIEAERNPEREASIVIGGHDSFRLGLSEPAFVGRKQELATLLQAIEHSKKGTGGAVTLESLSGGGKSRLLHELQFDLTPRGYFYTSGHISDQMTMRPFQILEGVAKQVISRASYDVEFRAHLAAVLADQRELLCGALPQLSAIFSEHERDDDAPQAQSEYPVLRALSAFFMALGTEKSPAVVVLDDCQWMDGLSLKLIAKWLNDCDEQEKVFVTLVLSMREDEVSAEHPLRRLNTTTRVKLQPFAREDIQQLIESMAGHVPTVVEDAIFRLSEGSPFMAAELMRGLVEMGVLFKSGTTWQVKEADLDNVQSSRKAVQILGNRLTMLSHETRRILNIAAIIGKRFTLELIEAAAGMPTEEFISRLEEARSRQIIWMEASGSKFAFMHDKLRELTLTQISEDEKYEVHRSVAEYLAKGQPERVFEISYHFGEARDYESAFPFAVAAAEQARQKHELQSATVHYGIALKALDKASAELRFRIADGYSHVLTLAGNYAEAREQCAKALASTEDAFKKSMCLARIGELFHKQGDLKSACAEYEKSLALLQEFFPRTKLKFKLSLVAQLITFIAYNAFPNILTARKKIEDSERDLLVTRTLASFAISLYSARGPLYAVWCMLRGMNLANRYPETPELGRARANCGFALGILFRRKRGLRYTNEGVEICRRVHDIFGYACAINQLGTLLVYDGQYDAALERLFEAEKLFEKIGDSWQIYLSRVHSALAYYRSGDLPASKSLTEKTLKMAKYFGDTNMYLNGLSSLCRATFGKLPSEALAEVENRKLEGLLPKLHRLNMLAFACVRNGRYRAASNFVDEIIAAIPKVSSEHYTSFFPNALTVYRYELLFLRSEEGERRNLLFQKIESTLKVAKKIAKKSFVVGLHTAREEAFYFAMLGKTQHALEHLNKHIDSAEKTNSRYELALGLLARSDIKKVLFQNGWSADRERAIALFNEINAPELEMDASLKSSVAGSVSISLADRFSSIIDEGRHIVSSLSQEVVLNAISEGARILLRAEEVVCVRSVETERFRHLLAEKIVYGVEARARYDRCFNTEAASALIAPVRVRGETIALLVVSQKKLSDFFAEEEGRIAEYIVTLGGAALENAEGFAEIQAFSQELSHLVSAGKNISACSSLTQLSVSLQESFSTALKRQVSIDLYFSHLCFIDHKRTQGFYRLLSENSVAETASELNENDGGLWIPIEDPRTHERVACARVQFESGRLQDKEHAILLSLATNGANAISAIRLQNALDVVERQTAKIRTLFANITQGICSIDANMIIGEEYSRHLETILGETDVAGKSLYEIVFRNSNLPESARSMIASVVLMCVGWDVDTFEGNAFSLPREVVREREGTKQVLEIDWSPLVGDTGDVLSIMVVLRDVSELRTLREANEDRRRRMTMIDEVVSTRRDRFLEFILGSGKVLDEVRSYVQKGGIEADDLVRLKRDVHTLKGNSRVYGFSELADAVHVLEDAIFVEVDAAAQTVYTFPETASKIVSSTVDVFGGYREIDEKISMRAGISQKRELQPLVWNAICELESDVDRGVTLSATRMRSFVRLVKMWDYEDFSEFLSPLTDSVIQIAEALGKPRPQVRLHADRTLIAPEAKFTLSSVFTHLLRNAADHGLSRDRPGVIEVDVTEGDNHSTRVVLRDSGRGLNLARLREKGESAGKLKPDASDDVVATLIFESGLSTAEKVTDVSGRGVGMDAVRDMVQSLGGKISIVFEAERDALGYRKFCFEIVLPSQHLACNMGFGAKEFSKAS